MQIIFRRKSAPMDANGKCFWIDRDTGKCFCVDKDTEKCFCIDKVTVRLVIDILVRGPVLESDMQTQLPPSRSGQYPKRCTMFENMYKKILKKVFIWVESIDKILVYRC